MKEKNYLLTHKILSILSVFLLVVFTLCTSSFASETIFIEDTEFILSDDTISNYSYYMVCKDSVTNRYFLFVGNSPFTFAILDTSDGVPSKEVGRYILSDNINCVSGSLSGISDFTFPSVSTLTKCYIENICPNEMVYLYSNFNVFDIDGNVVFPVAPPEEEAPTQEIQAVELVKAIQVQEIPQQIAGILKIVLPIFLVIFGVLLVLYLIKSKNLLHL